MTRLRRTVVIDEPGQGAAVALKILTDAVEPFGLGRSNQS